jgi:hypothetical protein
MVKLAPFEYTTDPPEDVAQPLKVAPVFENPLLEMLCGVSAVND